MAPRDSHVYDALKGRKTRFVRHGEQTVLAAAFDGCCNQMVQLHGICINIKDAHNQIDADYAGQVLAFLKDWGAETGAYGQELDHRLRLSSELKTRTLELLHELHQDIDRGIECLQALAAKDEGFNEQSDAVTNEKTTAGIDDDEDMIERLDDILDDIQHTVGQLRRLTTELREAHPTDLDQASCSSSVSGRLDDSIEQHVKVAREMFKSAAPFLWNRLGRVSWRRRVYIRMIHDRRETAERRKPRPTVMAAKKAARRDIAVDAFNFQSPALKTRSDHSASVPPTETRPPHSKPPSSTIAPSEAPPSEVPSIFSARPQFSRTTSQTSLAFSTATKPIAVRSALGTTEEQPPAAITVLQTPKQIIDGEPYLCPFCGFEINLDREIRSNDDWQDHIFNDLFAYLCTFDNCSQARKVYGDKEDWYHHEISNHRISNVWICEECKEEFSEQSALKTHFQNAHSEDFSPSDAARVVALLRPSHSRKPLGRSRCPLCPSPVDSVDMRDHIALHLEEFCLTCLEGEDMTESSDSDEIMSQTGSDTMSEKGAKLRILQAFANEQHLITSANRPSHAEITEADDLRDDSDDEEPRDPQQGPLEMPNVSRSWRVQSLMAGADGPVRGPTRARSNTKTTNSGPYLDTRTFPKDDNFKGREKELINLYNILSEPGRVYVLSAEGGMGKTALAVEFTYRFEHVFECIFWVQAETPVGASETFNQIALTMGLASSGEDQQTLTQKGRDFLQTTEKRWLLVFDNVEKWDDIDGYTPVKTSTTTGSILITTRYPQLTAPSRPVNYYRKTLEELSIREGADLLLHGLPPELQPKSRNPREDPDMKAIDDIAGLAGLPLAIVLISGYMKAMNCSPTEFWSYWDSWWLDNRPDLRTGDQATTRGRLEQIMRLSVEDLGDETLSVMRIMAFLASDGVQKDLLTWDQAPKSCQYLRTWKLKKILNDLVAKRFISIRKEEGKEAYVIHRALQSRLLLELHEDRERWEELFGVAFRLVRHRLPRPSSDTTEQHKWNQFKEYIPHVAALQRVYADPTTGFTVAPFVDLAELFKDGGVLLWQRFLSNDAMRLLVTAERILDQIESNHDDLRAEIHVTMNLLLQYLGIARRKESSERFQKILDYRQKRMDAAEVAGTVTDTDRTALISAKADYANSLLQFNRFRDAEEIYKDCYESLQKISSGKDEAFSFAKLNHHMAYCSMYHHQFDEAKALSEKAVALIGELGAPALLLRYQFDQACILLQSGDKQGALDLQERILTERVQIHGKESYFTLQSQYAVAAIYAHLERWDDAEWQLRDALLQNESPRSKSIWPDAAVARTKYHLAQVLMAKGDREQLAEAEQLAKDGKDILSRLLVYDPINGVAEEDTGALFDHLQPVFGGRWTGLTLLKYVS